MTTRAASCVGVVPGRIATNPYPSFTGIEAKCLPSVQVG